MPLHAIDDLLSDLTVAEPTLRSWGLRDLTQALRNLHQLAHLIGVERLADLVLPFGRYLPRCPDPDMGLNNFERFLAHPEAGARLLNMPEARTRTLEILLQLLSISQYFSDL